MFSQQSEFANEQVVPQRFAHKLIRRLACLLHCLVQFPFKIIRKINCDFGARWWNSLGKGFNKRYHIRGSLMNASLQIRGKANFLHPSDGDPGMRRGEIPGEQIRMIISVPQGIQGKTL